jgi:predicted DNA-binding transcriptional regulator YafY
MSKRGYISRYLFIVKIIQSKPYCSFDEIRDYIENQIQYLQLDDDSSNLGVSKRTFQRDIQDIRKLFGLDIEYSASQKGYFIQQDDTEGMNFRKVIESFELFDAFKITDGVSRYISTEKKSVSGSEHIYGILHAIKNRFRLEFYYEKYWAESAELRNVESLAIKEFKGRWYLIAVDQLDGIIKCFGLDRMSGIIITNRKFSYPKDFEINEHFFYSYGIMAPLDNKPVNVELSFDPFQGKYIKSLPLHHTQEIKIDSKEEFRITLKLSITHDFIMELLSHGEMVKVIKPKSLSQKLINVYQKAQRQYN